MPAYEQIKYLKPSQLRRLCGVDRATFERMVAVVQQARASQLPGRPAKLLIPEQILLTLEYLRE